MAYQVLARKWRPQKFDEVIGQRGVTQTLRNAIAAQRIAQSFVFAGPRGVGKTTTARILARGLNCVTGPTADPCGTCDACLEIAQGRDMDVIEIDAATNTQVDKVRQVIIEGLGMAPVRDRYKIFIIDEVHRLSPQSFDALLKSIEEPPPHVVFMMATTEIDKVPPTIQSRSQVFELKLIGIKPIAEQLRAIATAEEIEIDDAAVMLIARAGDGSMRDAQSAFDQVIAFAGKKITPEDVAGVLGLVHRDLLLDIADAVAAEDAAAVFALAGRAVESGYELRSVVRELARLTRDLMVVKIDASRASDPEIAAEGQERTRIVALAPRFSSEDLMRAFEVLTKAEYEIRGSTQPRYHLEMALLRWIHLRKLVPLSELIQGLETGAPAAPRSGPAGPAAPRQSFAAPTAPARPSVPPKQPAAAAATARAVETRREAPARPAAAPAPAAAPIAAGQFKEAFLEDVRKAKKFFHGTVVAMAQKIEHDDDKIVFTFGPHHRALRAQLDQNRTDLEERASRLAGRRITIVSAEGVPTAAPGKPGGGPGRAAAAPDERKTELKQQALEDSGVQAMLDVFAAEIKDVEER
ncbi:MAG: DNA polymerase III subunit gamma/tau [Acidobacteriota bacterium]|nr:DNA polymerase III subunit gamma/tau [Acidobacteriota bacterium]